MKAPSTTVESMNGKIADTVWDLHKEINEVSLKLRGLKKEYEDASKSLKEDSLEVFSINLGEIGSGKVPEIHGNHEYRVKEGVVTVNYRMKPGGLEFSQIGGVPAKVALGGILNEKEYKRLFKERVKVVDSEGVLERVREGKPELVGLNFNPSVLSEEELEHIRSEYPHAFSLYVKDHEKYVEEYPDADVEVTLSTSTGFIDKVANLPYETKRKLGDLIRKILLTTTTSAVKCGNKSSTK